MSWNIEIAVFKNCDKDINEIVPDVFVAAENNLFFDEAASSSMLGKLSAAKAENLIILVDTSCRLYGKIDELALLSNSGDLYFVRVAMDELVGAFKKGRQLTSSSFFGRIFGKRGGPVYTQEMDGEQRAWQFLSYYLGAKCPDKLLELKFQAYELDM